MKHLADRGKTVVTTIHQPSSQIIELLDDLLIIHEGRVVFLGPTSIAAAYFAEYLGQPCPPLFNVFDHIMAVISTSGSPSSLAVNASTMARTFQRTDNYKDIREIIHKVKVAAQRGSPRALALQQRLEAAEEDSSGHMASTFTQYRMNAWRSLRTFFRTASF